MRSGGPGWANLENPGKLELTGWHTAVIGGSQQESGVSDRPVAAVRIISGRIPHEVVLRALLGARNGGGISCLVERLRTSELFKTINR